MIDGGGLVETAATVITTAVTSTGLVLAFVRKVVRAELKPLAEAVAQIQINEDGMHRRLRRLEVGVYGDA